DVGALGAELRAAAIATLVAYDADRARAHTAAWHSTVLVRNRVPRARGGLAQLQLDVALAHVPVGPGSAGRRKDVSPGGALPFPAQVIATERRYARIEAPRFYPVNHEVERRQVLAWLPPLPGLGILALPLNVREPRKDAPSDVVVKGDATSIASAIGRVTIVRSMPKWSRRGMRALRSLLAFETTADLGDTYTPSLRGKPRRASARRSHVSLRGPLRGAIDTAWRFARGRGAIEVSSRVSLDAGASFVRISVNGTNAANDHRLRILIDTGVRPRKVLADSAFALMERKPLRVPAADRRMETPPATAPLHRFVSLFDGKSGCTVISDGLAEYEVLASGEVAVTLVRALGELSRDDLPERPGHAGWPAATPYAQCHGPFAAEFAVAWHAGDSPATRAEIFEIMEDALLPLVGETRRDVVTLPAPSAGIALEGKGLVFSALKESEDGKHVVARCVNVTDVEVQGAWILSRPAASAQRARLDETPLGPIAPAGNRIPLTVLPFAVDTVLITPSDER
ncbi:MAG: glycoside hydrolase family 38 C-terminal domain-containing protein, partial [Gemmatimonadota bacterium]